MLIDNSEDTPKSPILWWKNGKVDGWWDKYPPNLAGNNPARERGKGVNAYKRRGGTTGVKKNWERRLGEEQERKL